MTAAPLQSLSKQASSLAVAMCSRRNRMYTDGSHPGVSTRNTSAAVPARRAAAPRLGDFGSRALAHRHESTLRRRHAHVRVVCGSAAGVTSHVGAEGRPRPAEFRSASLDELPAR